jgi:phosphate acetyltransferase
MKHILMLVPAGRDVGLTSISISLVTELRKSGYHVGFLKPISQRPQGDFERSVAILEGLSGESSPSPIPLSRAEKLLSLGQEQVLMEEVVEIQDQMAECDLLIVEGLVSTPDCFYSKRLNRLIARALDADLILVSSPHGRGPEENAHALDIEVRDLLSTGSLRIVGHMMNKVGRGDRQRLTSGSVLPHTNPERFGRESEQVDTDLLSAYSKAVGNHRHRVLALIPWSQDFVAPRLVDFTEALHARALRRGDADRLRIRSIASCTQSVSQALLYFQEGALILTTHDRSDILMAAAMAWVNGIKLGGILVAGDTKIDANVLKLCEQAFVQGLPLYAHPQNLFDLSVAIANLHVIVPQDDLERAREVIAGVVPHLDHAWIHGLAQGERKLRMTPPRFRSQLITKAKNELKRIVLPEGTEPRTLQAANIVAERGIAIPVLLGNPAKIREACNQLDLELSSQVEVIDPARIAENYVAPMVELRKSKGLTPEDARKQLLDEVVLGTMMLKAGDVDGLVSGALHTTADTVRPALQLIKCKPGVPSISSVFFMCLPDQVLVYGDCAISLDPNAEELAQIAIQSADSAKAFGIEARVAMISYSTGTSGQGADVDKVRTATALVKEMRPDLIIDGPIQYDAAVNEAVAKSKAPNSPLKGKATVLVFPDLNTGNTTYKAVQRSAGVESIGPMLQGLAKPVNDLSRGALVDDIVYTIALTAIQAQQQDQDA